MSMKSTCKFQAKSTGSCETVQTRLWRRPDAPQCLTNNNKDVYKSEQHYLDARSIIIQHEVGFQKSTLIGKSPQAVRTTWQHIGSCPAFQNIPVFRSNATRSYSEDHPDAWLSCSDVDLTKIELRYFWKDIAENRSDVANFRQDARQPELESQ